MRKALTTTADDTYDEQPGEAPWTGFDGWLTAVRAFFFLIGGMLLISLLTAI